MTGILPSRPKTPTSSEPMRAGSSKTWSGPRVLTSVGADAGGHGGVVVEDGGGFVFEDGDGGGLVRRQAGGGGDAGGHLADAVEDDLAGFVGEGAGGEARA